MDTKPVSDPRGNVRPGDPLRIAAEQINFLNRLMAADTSYGGGPLRDWSFSGNTVAVKNTTDGDVARWGVLKIAGVEIDPNDGDRARRSFESLPCLVGEEADGDVGTFVVAIEPIKQGKVGRAAVDGVVQVTQPNLDIIRSAVQVIWEDGSWALIRLGGTVLRLAQSAEDIDKGSAGKVVLFREDAAEGTDSPACAVASFDAQADEVCAQNLIGDVRKDDWVYVAQVGGGEAWHILTPAAAADACGRVARDLLPLAFSACRGSGAKATAHLTGACPGPIESVDISSGGSGYAIKARVQPVLDISGSGDGATFSVTLSEDAGPCGDTTWAIASVSVSGGTGYRGGERLSITPEPGAITRQAAILTLNTSRSTPTLAPTVCCGGGASLSVSVASNGGSPETWRVASVTVSSGGSGYSDGAPVSFSLGAGDACNAPAVATVTTNENGAITAVSVAYGGVYYHEAPDSVTVTRAGKYYLEDPEGEPYVAEVTVSLAQLSPSAGAGATFSATVDDDPSSPNFGRITGIAITDPGDDYVDQGYDYPLTFGGMKFSDLPGYDGSAVQILGHSASGCLSWFNVSQCGPTSGVCCSGGEVNATHTTQGACESNGGTWNAGAAADDLPGPCCE